MVTRHRLRRPSSLPPLGAAALLFAIKAMPVWLAAATVATIGLLLVVLIRTLYARRDDPYQRLIGLATVLRSTGPHGPPVPARHQPLQIVPPRPKHARVART